jgi:hypothetical protein
LDQPVDEGTRQWLTTHEQPVIDWAEQQIDRDLEIKIPA